VLGNTQTEQNQTPYNDLASRKPVASEGAVDRAATGRWQGPVSPYQGRRVRVVPGDVLPQREGSSGDKSDCVGNRKRAWKVERGAC